MLTLYRRHVKSCQHRNDGRNWWRCTCPVWCYGTLRGLEVRRTVATCDWEVAQKRIREWEIEGLPNKQKPLNPSVANLRVAYMADMEARKLAPSSIRRYGQLLRQIEAFGAEHDAPLVSQWNLDLVRSYRQSWLDTGMGAVKKLERLRTVLRFALDSGWINDNPAAKLKPPKVKDRPTLPLIPEQMRSLLVACSGYLGKRRQLSALVLLMRYSGLRIGDALTLARDRIVDGKLFLYTQKTGTPVWCPLPEVVLDALTSFEPESERYFFWSGQSEPGAFSRLWMKKLNIVFRRAGIEDGHSHRFRDSYAVGLLLAGVPMERVSVLLGHSSIKVTQKHYSPWVKERQEQLEADVRRSWSGDPITAAKEPAKVVPITR